MWYNSPINAEIIKFIQSFSNPFLDSFFQFVTMFGEEAFFMLAIPIIYWCINKELGYKLGLASLSSTAVNCGLKDFFMVPRPIGEPGIRSLRIETAYGYSFPSGHTQSTTTFWINVMLHYKTRKAGILALLIIIFVGLSRLYLGVHRPVDVIGGLVIGFIWVLLSNILYNTCEKTGNKAIYLIMIIPLLIVMFMLPNADYFKAYATLLAFYAGYIIEPKYIRFDTRGTLQNQVLKLVIGLGVLFALRIILKQLLPVSLVSDFIRYLLVGGWAAIGAPYLFSRFFTPRKHGRDIFIQ